MFSSRELEKEIGGLSVMRQFHTIVVQTLCTSIRWISGAPTNLNAQYPRPYPGNAVSAIAGIATMAGGAPAASGNNFYPQDKYLLNLAYLRLKNLTFGYTIPANLTKMVKMEKVRIYFSGQNLFEKAQNKIPIDAEITQGSVTSSFYGRTAPFTRTLSFGLQVTL